MTQREKSANLIWAENHFPTEEDYLDFRLAVDGVFAVDRHLLIISFSEAAERISGFRSEQVVGKDCYQVLRFSICKAGQLASEVIRGGGIFSNLNAQFVNAEGETIEVVTNISPLMGANGTIAGAVMTFRDLAEMDRLARALLASNRQLVRERNKLTAILNSITDGVFTIDTNWKITSFNQAAQKITGYSTDEVLGKFCGDVLRGGKCGSDCPMRRTLKSGEPIYDLEVEILSKDGRVIPVKVTTSLLLNENGEAVGAVETFRDLSFLKQLRTELEDRYRFDQIIGKSKPMQALYELLSDVAATDATVLVEGESGTGKELVVKAIHFNSPRRNGPFVSVNCAALPEALLESELFGYEKGAFTGAVHSKPGRFELADGGTLFLDEIGELSFPLQAKLLRVLDQHVIERVGGLKSIPVNVRIVAATNRNLQKEVEARRFREDLYYRLKVVPIYLPPLRERKEDIPLLVNHFIEKFNRKMGKKIQGISPQALRLLMNYDWPGNVRELENLLEFTFIQCKGSLIEASHLPLDFRQKLGAPALVSRESHQLLEDYEKELIEKTLAENWGSRIKTARQLGLSKVTLWRKMKKYGLLQGGKGT